MTICKYCIHCERVRYDGGNRSDFRPDEVDDYIYYCELHGPVANEHSTCKAAEE